MKLIQLLSKITDRGGILEAIDMINDHGFYNPYYEYQTEPDLTESDGTPVDSFLSTLDQETMVHPFTRGVNVLVDPKNPNVVLATVKVYPDMEDKISTIHISEINSAQSGGGRTALNLLMSIADKFNVALTLDPIPYGNKNMDKDELIQWYSRNGFVEIEYEGMVREPNRKSPGEIRLGGVNRTHSF